MPVPKTRQAWSSKLASRMCSRLDMGSASIPSSASSPETEEATRSR